MKRGLAILTAGAVLMAILTSLPVPSAVASPPDEPEPTEITSMRTATSKTFLNSGGTYVTRIYGGPIHYFDGSGWADIDLALKDIPPDHPLYAEGYRKAVFTNSLVVAGKADISADDFLLVSPRNPDGTYGDYWLKITLRGVGYYDNSSKENKVLLTPDSVVGQIQAKQILFENVFPGADFRYVIVAGMLKEEIVFEDPSVLPDPANFGMNPGTTWVAWEYELKYGGVAPVASPDLERRAIDFVKFFFPVGWAADSSDNASHRRDTEFRLIHQDGRHFLAAGVKYSWLTHPDVVFPVIFDPCVTLGSSVSEGDTFVYEESPNTSYGTTTTFYVGGVDLDGDVLRGFVNFDLSSLLSSSAISQARLYVYCNFLTGTLDVDAYRTSETWNENTLTWNNQPGVVGGKLGENSISAASAWYSFDVTAAVRDGLDENEKVAIRLSDNDEAAGNKYAKAASKENGTPSLHPYLEICGAFFEMKVENQVSPQNLTTFTPEFSFKFTDDIGLDMQVFRIQVGTSEGASDMWDNTTTQENESGDIVSITYNVDGDATALSRGTTYWWRVNVQDNEDNWSGWSDNENFKLNQLPVISAVKTENQTNPTSLLFVANPVFYWTYSDDDGDAQSHYEVWVGTSAGDNDMWASGRVENAWDNATYAGSVLSTAVTYYVQVRAKDNREWSAWDNGTFQMTPFYNIELRWEENNELATTENGTLTAYMGTYGTQENAVVDGTLENVTYLERPYLMQLAYSDYYRSYMPTTDNGTITFYITNDNALALYTFQLVDLTGLYGPPTGKLAISKMYGENTFLIHEAYWQADLTISAYLIQNHMYQLTATSDLGGTRVLGGYIMTTSPIQIQISEFDYPDLEEVWNNIYWLAYRASDNTTIRAVYQDSNGLTTAASVAIYDENGTLKSFMEPDNNDFIASWASANPYIGYNVVLNATRNDEDLPSITLTTPIAAIEVPDVTPPTEGGPGFGNPVPLAAICSFIMLGAMGLAFDSFRAHIGGLAIALTAIFLAGVGWLPLNLYTIALVLILAVIFSLGFKRR